LAARGAAVVVNDTAGAGTADGARADAVVAEIEAAGGEAAASYDSVATPEGGRAVVDVALDRFGSVDVVVNNAGFLRSAPFESLTVDHIDDVLDVHLRAAFFVTQPAWQAMLGRGYGRIVLTSSSSTFGQQANSNYAAAKAGILGLTTALAAEGEEHGIRVNAVLPYAVSQIAQDTPLVGQDTTRIRAGLDALTPRRAPESVAPLVLFLASRACPFNGHAYSALAGRFARVFSGTTTGWLCSDTADLHPEDIAAHLIEIEDTASFRVPTAMIDEIEDVLDQVRRLSAAVASPADL
jgi:NAD(P)-dependent dehydrogenase (short-subunit alcohol dehydrogenase family)